MRRHLIISLLFGILFLTVKRSVAQCPDLVVDHWEACVSDNQNWKYIVPYTDIPDWKLPAFNDAAWANGIGGIGYGDNDDATVLPNQTLTLYMRRTFTIVDTAAIKKVVLCLDYDDGIVVYLNGVRVEFFNITASPSYLTAANIPHEAALYQGLQPRYTLFSFVQKSLLQNGTNVICVEVHNQAANDNDLTARPFLMLGLGTPAVNYSPVPQWFVPPPPLYSNLPIVKINTWGQLIVGEPRIICDMGVIDNGPGNMNCQNDASNNYQGNISIEERGHASGRKPQYNFSTVDGAGIDSNVALLGFPQEHDFTLFSLGVDETGIHDVFSYHLANLLHWYSSRTRYVEVIMNGVYQGLYVVLEKVKVDKARVDISKITPLMNAGDELTGGYSFKIDRHNGNAGNWWNTTHGVEIQNHDPNWMQVTPTQRTYLMDYLNQFENVLWGVNFADPDSGYRKYINVYSFADFFLLNEMAGNIDAYKVSTFFYKDRDSKCGRLSMGPLWDMDYTFEMGAAYNKWVLDHFEPLAGSKKWFGKLLQDPWFKNILHCRWNELRQNEFSTANLHAWIDSTADNIMNANLRDSLLQQVPYLPLSLQGRVDTFKNWLTNRLNWMDANIYPATQACNALANMPMLIDEINFHSDSSTNSGDWLELFNYGATPIDISHAVIFDGDRYEQYCVIPANTVIPAGGRLIVYADSNAFATQFPTVMNKTGPLCFKLNNAGQKIVIRDQDQKLICSMTYQDMWQCSADGKGRTLQLQSPAANPNLSASWIAGCMGGSPGVAYASCHEDLIYSEINYKSAVTFDAGDWIELHNKTNNPYSLAGWTIRDGSANNVFTFPANTLIPPASYLVAYTDAIKFGSRFPTVVNKIGPLGFGFSSTGDAARVFDNNGKLRYSVCYGSSAPWPLTPNGGGYTLENRRYNGNHNADTTWFAGCLYGSPGYAYDSACTPVGLLEKNISEAAMQVYPNPTAVKLYIYTPLKVDEVSIFDPMGRLIFTTRTTKNAIDVSLLPQGIYHLQAISRDGKRVRSKFAVSK